MDHIPVRNVAVYVFPRDEPLHAYWRDTLAVAGVEVHAGEGGGEGAEVDFCASVAARIRTWRPDLVHAIPGGALAQHWTAAGHLPDVPVVATETSEASPRCF